MLGLRRVASPLTFHAKEQLSLERLFLRSSDQAKPPIGVPFGETRAAGDLEISRVRMLIGVLAVPLIALCVWQLESARRGLSIAPLNVGDTPATVYRYPDAAGPAVVIAHGFAGSRQLMEAFALTLARAGYIAVSFDFQGHGRNPVPMSGDVTRIEGTTKRLVAETASVIEAVLGLEGVTGPVALVGHSMASDIVIRLANAEERVAAVVAVSMYSEAVTADTPARLLIVTGAWERHLRSVALESLRLVDPQAEENETAENRATGTLRRAVVAPDVEHVGVLYSPTSLQEARRWIDDAFGRESSGPVAATGPWIALLLVGIVLLAWPLSGLLPEGSGRPETSTQRAFLLAVLLPAVLTPLVLYPVSMRVLPVLVADYLALHLLLYGLIALATLRKCGMRFGRPLLLPTVVLLAFGLGAFGLALDRYAASFVPHAGRIPIVLAMALGAVPFMIADSLLTEGGRAKLWRRLLARAAFFGSLGVAVALDFEGLFFLLIILPVILLFFLVFGLMGGCVGRRSGSPVSTGLALGLILAWALGVSFPLIAA